MSYTSRALELFQYLERVKLPARGPVGSLQNHQRSRLIAAASHQWRVKQKSRKFQKKHRAGCQDCMIRVPMRRV